MSQKDYDMVPRWYVVHTYSGYENKVKTDLEKTVKNREKKKRRSKTKKRPLARTPMFQWS